MYLHPSVSTDKVLNMLQQLRINGTELHQFSMYCHGEKMVEIAPFPYSCKDKRRVNSVSKTFTSTAVGICFDKGLLKPSDKLISFFPEEMTKNADEKVKDLTIHDLLTMSTGIADTMPDYVALPNILEAYFSNPHEALTKEFHYSNLSTFMLSAVVTQVTKQTVLSLLQKEIFPTLGVTETSWPSLNGITEGAAGLRVSADDIAKHMQIYLEGGTYHGKRLLSKEWVDMATKEQVSTKDDNPFQWWTKGYGYQMWLNKEDGYRACGAMGQYGYVFPSLDIVVGEEALVGKLDETDDIYYNFCSDFTGESTVSIEELETYINSMYTPKKGDVSSFVGFDRTVIFDKNPMGLTLATLRKSGNTVEMELSDGEYNQTLRFGIDHWEENKFFSHHFRPELYVISIPRWDIAHFVASCTCNEKGDLEVLLRFRDCAFCYPMTIHAGEEVSIHFNTINLPPNANHITGHFAE